jgi:hypothetical protein
MGKKNENRGIRGKVTENGRRERIKWGQNECNRGKKRVMVLVLKGEQKCSKEKSSIYVVFR